VNWNKTNPHLNWNGKQVVQSYGFWICEKSAESSKHKFGLEVCYVGLGKNGRISGLLEPELNSGANLVTLLI